MPKKSIGKITIECDCGAKLECPSSLKGEITCACGKSYGVNQERMTVLPSPVVIPAPAKPYRPSTPWPPARPWYTTTCDASYVDPMLGGLVARTAFISKPTTAYQLAAEPV